MDALFVTWFIGFRVKETLMKHVLTTYDLCILKLVCKKLLLYIDPKSIVLEPKSLPRWNDPDRIFLLPQIYLVVRDGCFTIACKMSKELKEEIYLSFEYQKACFVVARTAEEEVAQKKLIEELFFAKAKFPLITLWACEHRNLSLLKHIVKQQGKEIIDPECFRVAVGIPDFKMLKFLISCKDELSEDEMEWFSRTEHVPTLRRDPLLNNIVDRCLCSLSTEKASNAFVSLLRSRLDYQIRLADLWFVSKKGDLENLKWMTDRVKVSMRIGSIATKSIGAYLAFTTKEIIQWAIDENLLTEEDKDFSPKDPCGEGKKNKDAVDPNVFRCGVERGFRYSMYNVCKMIETYGHESVSWIMGRDKIKVDQQILCAAALSGRTATWEHFARSYDKKCTMKCSRYKKDEFSICLAQAASMGGNVEIFKDTGRFGCISFHRNSDDFDGILTEEAIRNEHYDMLRYLMENRDPTSLSRQNLVEAAADSARTKIMSRFLRSHPSEQSINFGVLLFSSFFAHSMESMWYIYAKHKEEGITFPVFNFRDKRVTHFVSLNPLSRIPKKNISN